MELNKNILHEAYDAAIIAAQKASDLIASIDYKSIKVNHKNGGDTPASQVVTEVDLMAEKVILQQLNEVTQKYDFGILTEESPDDGTRHVKDFFWCIDPLDGTLPFTEGTAGYSVSIALVAQNGESVIGVIADPVCNVIYSAAKGIGAFRNGDIWTLPSEAYDVTQPLTLVCDRSFLDIPQFGDVMSGLDDLSEQMNLNNLATIHQGGGAMNAMWTIENAPAVYFKFPQKEEGVGCLWDYAAASCIYTELGANGTDMFGAQLELNRTESPFLNHAGVLYASSKRLAESVMQRFMEEVLV